MQSVCTNVFDYSPVERIIVIMSSQKKRLKTALSPFASAVTVSALLASSVLFGTSPAQAVTEAAGTASVSIAVASDGTPDEDNV